MMQRLHSKFIAFCLRHRIGRTRRSALFIFGIISIFEKFERYKNTKQIGNRGHYVPTLILRRFRIQEEKDKLGQLYFYRENDKTFGNDTISNLAQEKDFYVFREKHTGEYSDFTEKKLFGRLESFTNRIFDKTEKENENYEFTFLESSILATFVAFQMCRTPYFYRSLEKYLLFLVEKKGFDFRKELFVDDHTIDREKVSQILVKNKFAITAMQLKEYIPRISIQGKSVKPIIQSLANDIVNHIAKEVHEKYINIISTEENKIGRFLISDNPVVLVRLPHEGVCSFPEWWSVRENDIWIMFPFSPTRALLLTPTQKKDGNNYEKSEASLIELCNFAQFATGGGRVYSDDLPILRESERFFRGELKSLFGKH